MPDIAPACHESRPPGTNPCFFVPYDRALETQKALVEARIRGTAPDTLLVVEHEPVITMGSGARTEHLLLTAGEYRRRGLRVIAADRGGDVTYHGPGQLVFYPVIQLAAGERDAHRYLRALEDVGIRTCAAFGVEAFTAHDRTGVWTRRGKIAAVGVALRRWVTYHGMALNVHTDPACFETIIPCGLADRRVTRIADFLPPAGAPALEDAAQAACSAFQEVFRRPFRIVHGAGAPGEVPA